MICPLGIPISSPHGISECHLFQAPKSRKAILQDMTGKGVYLEACKYYEVIPASYFTRNISSCVVNLAHHGLGDNGVKPIVIALLQNTKVVELDLADNAITDDSGKDVARLFLDNFYITNASLASNHLGLATTQAFFDSFEGNGTLRVLNLSDNKLCDKSIEILCRGLINNYSLSELNLSRNKITEIGGKYIGNMLCEQRSLNNLDLSWNGLGPRGSEAVLKGLKENIVLHTLNLSWNAIGVDGCKAISRAFAYMNVSDFDISNNRLLVDGAKAISYGLKKNTSLESLKIAQNILENAGVSFILKSILKNPESKIKTMDITGTDLEGSFYELERELVANNHNIKFIHETRLQKTPAKALTDPRELLKKFLADNNIHKLDLFDFIDQDASMSVSVEEFKQGLKTAKCGLADFQIDELMDLLDQDHDGEIDYSEFANL